jgi:hypothetical protein
MFHASSIYKDLRRELENQKKKIAELENFKLSAKFQSAKSKHSEIRENEDETSFIGSQYIDDGLDVELNMAPP